MIAKSGDKNYSRLSAMLYFKGNIKFLDSVSPESFIPKPKVTSSIIRLTPLKSNNMENKSSNDDNDNNNSEKSFSSNEIVIDELNKEYSIICKALFQHKNKKIRNALIDSRHVLGYDDKKEIKYVLIRLMQKNKKLESLLINRTIATSPEEILEIASYLKPIIKDDAY
jgi:16S rRNA (adenine1518-N6/adenine1519-N6)-dimethyltransferase